MYSSYPSVGVVPFGQSDQSLFSLHRLFSGGLMACSRMLFFTFGEFGAIRGASPYWPYLSVFVQAYCLCHNLFGLSAVS